MIEFICTVVGIVFVAAVWLMSDLGSPGEYE